MPWAITQQIEMVLDHETGIGVRNIEGCVEVVGLDSISDKERESLQLILSIWKYGLQPDRETD